MRLVLLASTACLGLWFAGEPVRSAEPTASAERRIAWLRSGQERKRQTALQQTTWGSQADAQIVGTIAEFLQESAPRPLMTDSGLLAIHLLGSAPVPAADPLLADMLDAGDWRARLLAADALAQRRSGGEAREELLTCWKSLAAAQSYGLRHAIVCALAEADGTEGLEATVALLPELDGQLKYEAVARLSQRTGQNFGSRVEEWQTWWTQRPAGWTESDAVPEDLPAEVPWNYILPRFFGVRIYAKGVVFVVDMSNSMKSTLDGKTRMESTQEELQRAITGLPDDSWFDVILFNDRVRPWRSGLVPATTANRSAAIQAIWATIPERKTAVNDALETALDYPPSTLSTSGIVEQVLLLSDGKPTAGRLVQSQAIVANITQRNLLKRIRIDTLGLDTQGEPEAFLQQLSAKNFGKYQKLR